MVKVILVENDTFIEGLSLERKIHETFDIIVNVSYLGEQDVKIDRYQFYRCHRFLVVGRNDG